MLREIILRTAKMLRFETRTCSSKYLNCAEKNRKSSVDTNSLFVRVISTKRIVGLSFRE